MDSAHFVLIILSFNFATADKVILTKR